MLEAKFEKYILEFKNPSGTSRGVLKKKSTYFMHLSKGAFRASGEANLFKGLSADDTPDYEEKLKEVCVNIEVYAKNYQETLVDYPSIRFALEQALLKLNNLHDLCFDNAFSRGEAGIPINGLIWMGSEQFMQEQIEEKLADNFTCIKLKIGAIDFEKELAILKNLRNKFPVTDLEIRVDANGAFHPKEALKKLEQLAKFDLHSIEQPIMAGQFEDMASLCQSTPLPIALDEELIGIGTMEEKRKVLESIVPQFIILKPALVGGFASCDEWISLAESREIGWWITSALESNVGLDAIAQYTFSKNTANYQGLGTGKLFSNNIPSSLTIVDAKLWRKA